MFNKLVLGVALLGLTGCARVIAPADIPAEKFGDLTCTEIDAARAGLVREEYSESFTSWGRGLSDEERVDPKLGNLTSSIAVSKGNYRALSEVAAQKKCRTIAFAGQEKPLSSNDWFDLLDVKTQVGTKFKARINMNGLTAAQTAHITVSQPDTEGNTVTADGYFIPYYGLVEFWVNGVPQKNALIQSGSSHVMGDTPEKPMMHVSVDIERDVQSKNADDLAPVVDEAEHAEAEDKPSVAASSNSSATGGSAGSMLSASTYADNLPENLKSAPKPYEGVSIASYSKGQMDSFCELDWRSTLDTDTGRTMYNPCKMPKMFAR